ncbi:MAG: DCC1-like thiol-disulfide oxidoreductase family protein [Geminicoccaceae bacterium]
MANSWTGGQFSLYRVLFGIYLFVHFTYLIPWAPELFSSAGMLPVAKESPLLWLFPNILAVIDDPWFVIGLAMASSIASLFFCVGYGDRAAALFMWFVLACFFGRNPLTANPSLPYVGLMLLAHLFIPKGPYGSFSARGRVDPDGGWKLPAGIFLALWVVLALSYSYSGYTKLLSPSWVAGQNVVYVLENPLARDWWLRDVFLAMPSILLKLLTWFILVIELLFALFALSAWCRPFVWAGMLVVQFGFAFLLNFPDLTLAMLLFHLITSNPAWIAPRTVATGATLYFDGGCALCHGTVRFLIAEDRHGRLAFSPIKGKAINEKLPADLIANLPDSIVLAVDGNILLKSDAIISCLEMLGGLWRPIGIAMRLIPKPIRNWGYDVIASRRYAWFGTKDESCPLMPADLRDRFSA